MMRIRGSQPVHMSSIGLTRISLLFERNYAAQREGAALHETVIFAAENPLGKQGAHSSTNFPSSSQFAV